MVRRLADDLRACVFCFSYVNFVSAAFFVLVKIVPEEIEKKNKKKKNNLKAGAATFDEQLDAQMWRLRQSL